MNTTCILVEGKDDIAFLRRLIDKERQQIPGLGEIKWTLLNPEEKVILDNDNWVGSCYAFVGGELVAIMEVRGIYKLDEALEPDPAFSFVSTPKKDYAVDTYVGIFDADAPNNFLGNPVPYGGLTARRAYVRAKFSKCGKPYSFFLLADDQSDTTLEHLAEAIIKPAYAFILKQDWPAFRSQVQAHLQTQTGNPGLPASRSATSLSTPRFSIRQSRRIFIGSPHCGTTTSGIGSLRICII